MAQPLIHSLILILTVAGSFLISSSNLAQYQLQIIGIIFIIYFFTRHLSSQQNQLARIIDSVVFTLIISIIINSSGGLSSPLFFLYYFLIFTLALLLEPLISLTMTTSLIVIYLATTPTGYSGTDMISLLSLPFLTPFAIFIGTQMEKNLIAKTKIAALEKRVSDIKEEEILFLSLIVKAHIKTAQSLADNFSGSPDLEKLKTVLSRASSLVDKYEREIK